MKKIFILFVILFLNIFINFAYSSNNDKDILKITTLGDFPPFGSYDKNGKLIGFDIDLINLIASKLNKKVSIIEMPFNTMFVELQKNKVDLIIYALSITEERKKMVNFSDSYYLEKSVLIVRDDYNEIKSKNDINGKTIGIELGSSQDSFVEKNFKNSKNIKYKNVATAILNLKANKVDIVIADNSNAISLLKGNKGCKIVKGISFEPTETAIAFNKNNIKLLNEVNSILKEIKKNGELDELKKKWNLL